MPSTEKTVKILTYTFPFQEDSIMKFTKIYCQWTLKPIHNEIYQHKTYVTQTSNKKKTKKIYIIKISNKNYTRHMYIPARVRALEH